MARAFKACTTCNRVWKDRDGFLSDPGVVLVGYQANIEVLEEGCFIFNHEVLRCGTSLGIQARSFSWISSLAQWSGSAWRTQPLVPGTVKRRAFLSDVVRIVSVHMFERSSKSFRTGVRIRRYTKQ